MSANLIEQINALSDADAVSFLQDFNQSILDGIVEDFEELIEGIPPTIKSMPEFSEIDRLSLDEESQLEGEEAVAISRRILEKLANNPRFAPVLEKAMESYGNRGNMEMGGDRVKEILAVGLAASMILLVSTEKSFKYKGSLGEIEFVSGAANPAVVKTVMNTLANLPGK